MSQMSAKRRSVIIVGVVADTHGLVRPELVAYFAGVDRIIHAGDVGSPAVIETLRDIAAIDAVKGNVDKAAWAAALPDEIVIALDGKRLSVLHDLKSAARDQRSTAVDVVISGHSHQASEQWRDGVLYLNPGSAGPRRFKLPVTAAKLFVSTQGISAELHRLLA